MPGPFVVSRPSHPASRIPCAPPIDWAGDVAKRPVSQHLLPTRTTGGARSAFERGCAERRAETTGDAGRAASVGEATGGTQSALIGGADTLGEWHARDSSVPVPSSPQP